MISFVGGLRGLKATMTVRFAPNGNEAEQDYADEMLSTVPTRRFLAVATCEPRASWAGQYTLRRTDRSTWSRAASRKEDHGGGCR